MAVRVVLPSALYAILDVESTRSAGLAPLDLLEAWLDAGVRLVQVRAKNAPGGELLSLADAMVRRCRDAGAALIVNDRADVALMASADGVHVGQTDLPPSAVRALMGSGRWIGFSTHDDAQAAAARDEPIGYLAMGPVFATSTKHGADPPVGLEGIRRAAAVARADGRPLVAIGGITLASVPAIRAAGADAVAVVSDLLVGDPGGRARALLAAAEGAGEPTL